MCLCCGVLWCAVVCPPNPRPTQYPNVSIEQKRLFWGEILEVFEGLTVDFRQTRLNETSLGQMVSRGHRAVFYVSDYLEMTGYSLSSSSSSEDSFYALDACLIDNQLGNPSGPSAVAHQRELYLAADERKARDKQQQGLYLVSLVGDMNYVYAALLKFAQWNVVPEEQKEQWVQECADGFDTLGMAWCPETLLDGSQLANYYTQVAMDEVIEQLLAPSSSSPLPGLPHAIYLNALGSLEGTIRTGTEVLWGRDRSPDHSDRALQGFAYVDSFVLYNVLIACSGGSGSSSQGECDRLTELLLQRRAQNPLALWEDATHGRLISW